MTFGESVSTCFSKYATFSGRASRSEYWYFCLFNVLVGFAVGFIDGLITVSTGSMVGTVLSYIYSIAVFLPSLGVFVRRMHDTGRSGWWFFLNLIPIIGSIIVLLYLCQPSAGANEYGEA